MGKLIIDIRMINSSGIGTYIRNIVPKIIMHFSNKHIILLCSKEEYEYCNKFFNKFKNVELRIFDANIYSIKEQILYLKLLFEKYDLFWSPHYNIPYFSRGKLLVTIHDMYHISDPLNLMKLKEKIYARLLFNRIEKRADSIITISQFSNKEILNTIPKVKKVNVIYNGLSSIWKEYKKSNVQKKEFKYFIYVGNVKPHKNLGNLYKAIKPLLKEDIKLIIVGKREGFINSDTEIISEAANDKNVIFTGLISDEDLMEYVSNAEALIFPSIYEGFGLPPIEAMAVGCPTIVSEIASIPEVCGDASIYFQPFNIDDIHAKIVMLIENPELKNNLVKCGYKQIDKYDWKNTAYQTIQVFEEVLSK